MVDEVLRPKTQDEWVAECDRREQAKVEAFEPEPAARLPEEWGRQATAVCGLLIVALLLLGGFAWQRDAQAKRVAGYEQARLAAVGAMQRAWREPAPIVRKGPMVAGMASWLAENAGDNSYNGTYVEDGTFEGNPLYTNGTRLLYFRYTAWRLGPSTDTSVSAYYENTGGALPGTWSTVEGNGTYPAPTVSEAAPAADPLEPSYYTGLDAPAVRALRLRTCRATIGGVEYVVFALEQYVFALEQYGFALYNVATGAWSKQAAGDALFARSGDQYHTPAVFSALDGTHVYATNGALHLGNEVWQADWGKWDLTDGSHVTSYTLTLPSRNTSNFLQLADGTFRFFAIVDGVKSLYSFAFGDASPTLVVSYETGADLPAAAPEGVEFRSGREDMWLYHDGTDMRLSRRCKATGTFGQNRFAQYVLTDTTATLSADVILTSTTGAMSQTWAIYDGEFLAEIGQAPFFSTAIRWTPGSNGVEFGSLGEDWANQRYYVAGDPLLLSGISKAYPNELFVFEIPAVLAVVPSAIADTTAYTPTVVDVAAEVEDVDGIGTGAGDATLISVPFVFIAPGEGVASGEGSAEVTSTPPNELAVEGVAGGVGDAQLVQAPWTEMVAEGIGVGVGNASINIRPALEVTADGAAGGDGDAALEIIAPTLIDAEGAAGGEGDAQVVPLPPRLLAAEGAAGGTGEADIEIQPPAEPVAEGASGGAGDVMLESLTPLEPEADGVAGGTGDATLESLAPVEPEAEGDAGGEGAAVVTVTPPTLIEAEGSARGYGEADLRGGYVQFAATGNARGSGAARLVSDTTPLPSDGPGALADLELTPGTWPGAERRELLPAYFGRNLNRRYGGVMVNTRPSFRTLVDTQDELAQHIGLWSWAGQTDGNYIIDAKDGANRLLFSTDALDTSLVTLGALPTMIVSGAPLAACNQVYIGDYQAGAQYVSADYKYVIKVHHRSEGEGVVSEWVLYEMPKYYPLSVMSYPTTWIDRSVDTGLTGPRPWEVAWDTATITEGDVTSRWRDDGLYLSSRLQIATGDAIVSESLAVGGPLTLLIDYTPTGLCSLETVLRDSLMTYEVWQNEAPTNWMSVNMRRTSGNETLVRVEWPDESSFVNNRRKHSFVADDVWVPGSQQRLILSLDGENEPVLYANETALADGSISSSDWTLPWPEGADRASLTTSDAYAVLHEFGVLQEYAASVSDVSRNLGLARAYGYRANTSQMTDRPV